MNASEFKLNLAVVIGINDYRNGVPTLGTARQDAEAIADILKTEYQYQVHLITDTTDTQATSKNLQNYLETELPEILKKANPSRLLFYFAGHGIALNGDDGPQGYLIPQDAKLGEVSTYLPMQQVEAALTKLSCRHCLVILDCCFAGAFRWSSTRKLVSITETIHKERYDRFIQDPAWQVITSAASDQCANDSLDIKGDRGIAKTNTNHSPFAAALMEALSGKADAYPVSSNGKPSGDGVITATELYMYLRDAVEPATEEQSQRQTPGLWPLKNHDKGEYIFLAPGHPLNLPSAPPLDESKNPYRGLESFEEEHSAFFFGRTASIEKLYEFVSSHTLTVVLGASGSGKSSLVKAGLVPYLKQQLEVKSNEQWQILAPFRPGESPLKTLNNILAREKLALESITQLGIEEKVASLSSHLAAWSQQHPNQIMLLVIDQFEELITLCKDEQEREQFLALLAEAVAKYPKQLRLVLTLRSDFEPQFRETALKSYWSDSRFVVSQMTRADLREAIEKPAEKRVMYFEPHELVEQLIDEVADMPGALPLLSFGLSELYLKYLRRQRDAQNGGNTIDRALTQADYQSMGGVIQSLTQRADEEYETLVKEDPAYAQIIRQVMLRMVAIGGGELARRQVPLSELDFWQEKNFLVEEVKKRFTNARLLVEGQDAEGNPYIEPAHDALVRGWQKLLTWKQEEEENLILQRRLTPAAEEWKDVIGKEQSKGILAKAENVIDGLDRGFYIIENIFDKARIRFVRLWKSSQPQKEQSREQPGQFLWNTNPYLDVLNTQLQSNNNWFNQVEAEFVQESVLQRRQNTSWRWRIATAVILGLSGLAIAALIGQRNAQIQEISALREASEGNLSSNNQLDALLQSLQAGKRLRNNQLLTLFPPDSQQRDEVITTLRKVFYAVKESNRLKLPSGKIVGMSPSSDGKHLIVSNDGQGIISLRNSGNLEKVAKFPGHQGSNIAASFSPDRKQMVTWNIQSEKKTVIRLWDIASQTPIKLLSTINKIKNISFNSNGNRVAILTDDNAFLWDFVNNKVDAFTEFQQQEKPVGIGFTNDGKLLVATQAGNIFDWYSSKKSAIMLNRDDQGWIFSPDGQQLLVTGFIEKCSPVEKYELSEKNATPSELKEGCVVKYSPDGNFVAIGDEDGNIYIHDHDLKKESFIELKAHQGDVKDLSFSSNSKQLFSLGNDDIIKLWQLEPKKLDNSQPSDLKSTLNNTEANQDSLKFIGFSSDGNQIIRLQSDGKIFLSNLSGKNELLLETEPDSKNNIVSAVVSSDKNKIAIARKDNTIEQRNIFSSKAVKSFPIPKGEKFHHMVFHPTNGNLIVITGHPNPQSKNSETDFITHVLYGDTSKNSIKEPIYGEPIGLSFGLNDDLIVHTSQQMSGGALRLESFDWNKQQRVGIFNLSIWDKKITVSKDTNLMATATEKGTVKLWDFWGKRLLTEFKVHQTKIESINFSSDNSSIITVGEDGIAKSWRIGNLDDLLAKGCDFVRDYLQNKPKVSESDKHLCDEIGSSEVPKKTEEISTSKTPPVPIPKSPDKQAEVTPIDPKAAKEISELKGHQGSVRSVAFSPNGQTLATSGEDGTIRLWNAQGQPLSQFKGNQTAIRSINFSPDGQQLVSDAGSKIRLWNLQGKLLKAFVGSQKLLRSVKFSPDGQQLASTGDDGTIHMWNLQGKPLAKWQADPKRVWDLAFSPDGQQLASAEAAGNVGLWSLQGKSLHKFTEHISPILSVAFSSDGKQLVSGCNVGMLRSWGLPDYSMTSMFHSNHAELNSVAYSPDGKLIVSGDNEGNIKMWKLNTQQQSPVWTAHQNSIIRKVAFSPDGKMFATAADNGIAKLWQLK
jgi:WD40 repeat protein